MLGDLMDLSDIFRWMKRIYLISSCADDEDNENCDQEDDDDDDDDGN